MLASEDVMFRQRRTARSWNSANALELTDVDLVAKDTGGAITQLFATGNPERLHTPTPTNCEAHDNLPPPRPY